MKNLEIMISRARSMMVMGKTADEVRKELRAQGVDNELAFWAVKAAIFEIEHWKKENAKNAEA